MTTKEHLTVFLFDVEESNRDSSDVLAAVVYFYPSSLSSADKSIICCHLSAVSSTFGEIIGEARIISFQNNKYVLKQFDNFLLAVGSDQNLCDWFLEQRFDMLTDWLHLYHNSFQDIEQTCKNRAQFADKMFRIFEGLIKFLPDQGSIFQNQLHVSLPKSTSLLFLEAKHLLQYFQTFDPVVCGSILFENRIIASQFEPCLIRPLIQSDPYRVPTSAQSVIQNDQYQLLIIYVHDDCFQKERNDASVDDSCELNKVDPDTSLVRDCSVMFSTVFEEENDNDKHNVKTTSRCGQNNSDNPAKAVKKDRPRTLNLLTNTSDVVSVNQQNWPQNSKDNSHTHETRTPFMRHSASFTNFKDDFKVIHQSPIMICKTQMTKSMLDSTKWNEKNRSKSLVNLPTSNETRNLNRCWSISDPSVLIDLETERQKILKDQLKSKSLRRKSVSASMPRSALFHASTSYPHQNQISVTPLISQLKVLANEDSLNNNRRNDTKESFRSRDDDTKPDPSLSRSRYPVYLFVYGFKDLALYLILKDDKLEDLQNANFFECLIRNCEEKFRNFETQLYHCMELLEVQSSSRNDYNFVRIDDKWGVERRNSLIATNKEDNKTLALVNELFLENDEINELVLRADNGLAIFGHRMVGSRTLYWQKSDSKLTAISNPSDIFSNIQDLAKSRLLNDHSIHLL